MGNIGSVNKKLHGLGADFKTIENPQDLIGIDKIILPGVGHFAKAVNNLQNSGLWASLNQLIKEEKVPALGICLGMQLLGTFSEEGESSGFGWIEGNIKRFNFPNKDYKVPQIGWNKVTFTQNSKLFRGLGDEQFFYFVHWFLL